MNNKAIVVYVDNNQINFEEFSWLYKTWVLWDLYKEYDIVAYVNPKAIEDLKEYIGTHDNFLIRPLVPVYETNPFWQNYKFANSFYMFNDDKEAEFIKDRYKFIMKTDCDVFLTKHMLGLEPDRVMIGSGGYMQNDKLEEVLSNINRVSKKLKTSNKGLNHIGASIFGKTDILVNIIKNHFQVTKYILYTEWNESPGEWPGWFRGVSSMYAIHIVVNHFLNQHLVNLYSLDSSCIDIKIDSNTYHIHTWHTKDDFSKRKWFRGEYQKLVSVDPPVIAKDYCLWIASNDLKTLKSYEF